MTAPAQEVAVIDQRPRTSLIEKMASTYQMDPVKFAETIKATCIKGRASNEQFAAFLMVADKYGLNPLLKEVYAFPQDGGIVPIVGVDGWSRIINNHAQFDGMEFRDERDENGKVVSITCRMFRKDRQHAVEATEYLAECQRGTVPWKQWPMRMLRHKAMIQAARYAFGFTGIVEEDEWERRKEAERAAPAASQGRFISLQQPDYRPRYADDDADASEVAETDEGSQDASSGEYERVPEDAHDPAPADDAFPGDLPPPTSDAPRATRKKADPADPAEVRPLVSKVIVEIAAKIEDAGSADEARALFNAFAESDAAQSCTDAEFAYVEAALAERAKQEEAALSKVEGATPDEGAEG